MLHTVQTDQSACPTETCLAVDGDCARFLFSCGQELWDDFIRWCSTIDEEKVHMLDSLLRELLFFVLGLIQANYESHSEAFENGHIIVWGE